MVRNVKINNSLKIWFIFSIILSFCFLIGSVKAAILFQDGLESGDFSAWTGTSTGGSGTISISNAQAYHGTNSSLTTTDAGGDYGYVYKTIPSEGI